MLGKWVFNLQYCKKVSKRKSDTGDLEHIGDPDLADVEDQPEGEGEPAPKRRKGTMP